MKLLGDYIKSRRGVLLFFALAAALLGVSFALFHLPLRAVAYPCALALLLGLAALALDFRRVYKLHRELSQLETTAAELIGVLPAAASVPETDYQAIVQSLCRQSADAAAKAAADRASHRRRRPLTPALSPKGRGSQPGACAWLRGVPPSPAGGRGRG